MSLIQLLCLGTMASVAIATLTEHDSHHVLVSIDCSIEHIERGIGLDCQQATPPDFPDYLNEEFITELKVRHKDIPTVKQTMFHEWKNLREVEITGCGVKFIDADAFVTLDKLEHLNLEGVKYYDIDIDVETGKLNMSAIDITYNNKITYITAELFSKNTMLETLILRKNQIAGIAKGAFINLENLELLALDRNKLTEISRDTLNGLQNLKDLDLSFNQIEMIPNDAFYSLTSLLRLHLGGNPLKALTSIHLQPTPHLEVLDLYRTQITALADPLPDKLKMIDFGNTGVMNLKDSFFELQDLTHVGMRKNPWLCTYDIMKVSRWLWNHPNIVTSHDLESSKCASPDNLKGIQIDKLEQRHFPDARPPPTLDSKPSQRPELTTTIKRTEATQPERSTAHKSTHNQESSTPRRPDTITPRNSETKNPGNRPPLTNNPEADSSTTSTGSTALKDNLQYTSTEAPNNPNGPDAQQAIQQENSEYHGLAAGTIIGIIVAIAALCLVLGVIVYLYRQNRKWSVDMPHIYMKEAPPSDLKPVLQNSRYPYTGYTN
ncbi:unnamed protein product [Owenia fusiformis]|uniref:Uncharacterized protein n=1 Tax=Owenia fusiformis TaxID=6347 RepID=A0A8J1TYJ1_OWEFU|nr:unnamed protein product [Owenia fusiformis]